MNRLYPYILESKLVPAIWGGDMLATKYGKVGAPGAVIGESWECWAENVIQNGSCAGETLSQLWATAGPALMGLTPLPSRTHFPILTKLIDARESLSVQVHPDDSYAQRVEEQPNGKTECWVILEALPGAEIVLGFARDTDAAEVRRRAKDGNLNDILRRIKVKAGDVYFLPAGTVHAIGAGIVLFEVQQASDLTYRLYDWNRRNSEGQARELHLDKALEVLQYRALPTQAVVELAYRVEGDERRSLVADERFGLEELRVAKVARFFTESVCVALTSQETPVRLRTVDSAFELEPWRTVLIPAGIPRVEIESNSETSVFLVTPPGADERLRKRLELLGQDGQRIDAFLAQFAGHPASIS